MGADVDATGGVFEETPLIVAAQFGYRQAVGGGANIFYTLKYFQGGGGGAAAGGGGAGERAGRRGQHGAALRAAVQLPQGRQAAQEARSDHLRLEHGQISTISI